MNTALIFGLLVAYQVKHFLADYVLQGEYMLRKFRPDWRFLKPLLAHVSVHAGGTALICLALGKWKLVVPLALLDATLHFFMDRIKAGPKYLGRFKALSANEWALVRASLAVRTRLGGERQQARKALRGNTFFWWALGFDQSFHHLTHYGLIYLILRG